MINEFKFQNIKTYYQKIGQGPPMVFLHNGGGDHVSWYYQQRYFAKYFTTYAIDLPGFGLSDRPDCVYDLSLYYEFLKEFIGQLSLKNIILVGNCIGASIAVEYSTQNPQTIRALVLFNLCGGNAMLGGILAWFVRNAIRWQRARRFFIRLMTLLSCFDWYKNRHLAYLFAGALSNKNKVIEHLRKNFFSPEQAQSRFRLMLGLHSFDKFVTDFKLTKQLPKTALFWGAQNKVLNPRYASVIKAKIKPDRFALIQDTGHYAINEKPIDVNELIYAFIKDFRLMS